MDNEMKRIFESFLTSYAERDQTVDFSDWLAEQLQQEMPNMTDVECECLSHEIIEGIAQYNQALDDVGNAMDEGQSKEEWMADQMAGAYANMPPDDAGDRLRQIYNEMLEAESAARCEALDANAEHVAYVKGMLEDAAYWNELSLKDEALNIGKQAVMSGMSAATNAIKINIANRGTGVSSNVTEAVLRGMAAAGAGELKAVMAGVVRAAESKLEFNPFLEADGVDMEAICDLAGAAVEGAEALHDAATGKSSVLDAMDRVGRASVAALSRCGVAALGKSVEKSFPIAGPLVCELTEMMLDVMRTPEFSDAVYELFVEATTVLWEGVKQTARSIQRFFAEKAEKKVVRRLDA